MEKTVPKYPIGVFKDPEKYTREMRLEIINYLKDAPQSLREAVDGLSEEQLDTPYREGGWTLRQIVHHLADSNLFGYQRFKFALTEKNPIVAPFNQDAWSHLTDASKLEIKPALYMLEGIMTKWMYCLLELDEKEFSRQFLYPDLGVLIDLNKALCIYSWHFQHHTEQILLKRKLENW